MTVLLIVLAAVAYLLIGLGFVYLLGIETYPHDVPRDYTPFLCVLTWPIIAPVAAVLWLFVALNDLCNWVSNKGAKR